MRPPRARPAVRPLLATLLAAACLAGAGRDAAGANERLETRLDAETGLDVSEAIGLAQDSRGFVWIGTATGLFRYDGAVLRPWRNRAGEMIPATRVFAGPGGEVLFRDEDHVLWQVDGGSVRQVGGPGGAPVEKVRRVAWDREGAMWVATGESLLRRGADGAWTATPPSVFASGEVTAVAPAPDGGILVGTDRGLFARGAGGALDTLYTGGPVYAAVARRDGSSAVLSARGPVIEIRGRAAHRLLDFDARPIDLVEREGTLWASYDCCLVALRPDRPPEILRAADGTIPSGGSLVVDREGSLWMATFRGVLKYPEPETVAWSLPEGEYHSVRRLLASPEGIWMDTWGGVLLLDRTRPGWRLRKMPETAPLTATSALCRGAGGAVWAGGPGRLLERRGGRWVAHAWPGLRRVDRCATGADDRVWFATDAGLLLAGGSTGAARRGEIRRIAAPLRLPAGWNVFEDGEGRLWIATGESVCHAPAAALAAGEPVDWSCGTIPGADSVLHFLQLPSGRLWAGTLRRGIVRLRGDGAWETEPASGLLPGRAVRSLAPSPRGGVWVASFGMMIRLLEDAAAPAGWRVAERLGPWQGVMIADAEDLLEEPDGTVWIATLAGAVRVPPEARGAPVDPPPIALVEASSDGRPIDPGADARLPYDRDRIDLRFAALSYRDPILVRYQSRTRSGEPWKEIRRATLRFVDLPPGRYRAEMRASLDGAHWSPAAAGIAFRVLPPFWLTGWFLTLVAAALLGTIYAAYRYRVARLLEIERVRTRIATDLHDDIGSSLSQIAIQSEVLQRRLSSAHPEDRDRLSRIARVSGEMIDSMGDIIWAIHPKRDRLDDLVKRMRRFALDTADAHGLDLVFAAPEDGRDVPLDADLRRHAYLIFKESVSNAARHAGSRRVEAAVRIDAGRLEIRVRDDGRGFDPESDPAVAARGGVGLASMRRRAEEMGGILRIDSSPGRGTEVVLSLPLLPRRRRGRRRSPLM